MRIEKHPVIQYKPGKEVTFTFEGTEMRGYEGEPIAAALHANGVKVLRREKRARGFFCAIGNCSSCMMEVDGKSNVRTCITLLKEGMVVNRQEGQGKLTEVKK